MSIITQEEFFGEAFHFLKDIREYVKDISEFLEDNVSELINNPSKIVESAKSGANKRNDLGINSGSLDIKQFVESINSLDQEKSKSLIELTDKFTDIKPPEKSMANLSLLSEGLNQFVNSVNEISIEEDNLLNMTKLSSAVDSISSLSRSLTFNAPFILIGTGVAKLLPFLLGSLANGLVAMEGKMENIDNFPKTMRDIGIGLTLFSLGVAASIAILGYTVFQNPESLLGLGLVLTAVSLSAYIIGQRSEKKQKGAFAIGIMALALPIFALGVSLSAIMMDGVGADGLLMLGGVLALTALEFGIIGKFAPQILMGALAVAGIAVALWMFASPMKNLAEVISVSDDDILWKAPLLLTGIATVFGVAGLALPFILSGAVGFGAIGLSLIPLAYGLDKALSIKELNQEKVDNFTYTLDAVTGVITNMSLVDLLLLVPKLPILAGMGLALIPMAYGIESFMNRTKNFKDGDADRMTYVISKVSEAFATAGSTDGMSKLFGFNVGENDTERGIESTMKMGMNLDRLATGIGKWRDGKFTKEDVRKVGENVSNVMNTIPAVFADIGQRERGSGNQIKIGGFQFGVPFTSGDTELGIKATMRMGQNLTNLYQGVVAWKKGGANDISPHLPGIVKNISNVLTAIPMAFEKVGEIEAKSSKLMGMIDGNLEDGVELVERMTSPLKSLSNILTSFSKGIDAKKVSANTRDVILGVVHGVDMFTDRRINTMEDMIEQFEDFNDVIKDHFKILRDMPMAQMQAFGKHAESINSLHQLNAEQTVQSFRLGKQFVEKPQTENVTKVRQETVESETQAKKSNAKKQTTQATAKKQTTDNDIKELLMELIKISSNNKPTMDILNYLKTGTIKVEDDSL